VIVAKYGKSLPQERRRGGPVPVYGSNGAVGYHDEALTRGPTIIIGRKGSFGAINYSAVGCWPIDTTFYIDEPGAFSLEFLDLLLRSLELEQLDRSTAIPGLSRDDLYDKEVPVPPRSIQDEILRLVTASLGLGASSQAHLSTARGSLERFRRAVLAAACSGRLTADWRIDHPDSFVRPSQVSGTRHRKPAAPAPELELPDLPHAYALTTIGAVAQLLEYGTSKKADGDLSSVPVLRMGNVQDGRLDLAVLKYCTSDHEIERLMLHEGDLLFNRTNSPELVGKSAVFHETTPMTFASYLIRVRFQSGVADPDFVNYWMNSAWGRMWARHVKTDGVSQSNINGSKLAAMPLPLPPFEEQRLIVRRVEAVLDRAGRLTNGINAASLRVERIWNAVLAKALRGEFSPERPGRDGLPLQRPDDGPDS
jgi:type I restriction enzyme S subunit